MYVRVLGWAGPGKRGSAAHLEGGRRRDDDALLLVQAQAQGGDQRRRLAGIGPHAPAVNHAGTKHLVLRTRVELSVNLGTAGHGCVPQ